MFESLKQYYFRKICPNSKVTPQMVADLGKVQQKIYQNIAIS